MDEKVIDALHFKKIYENDNIYYKEKIKDKLLGDDRLIHFLNNTDLDEENPDDYFNVNIRPYYLIPETQTDVMNYICYESNFTEIDNYNSIIKQGQIIFYIFCDSKTIIDKETGIPRHDLLAAIIVDDFAWSNDFGVQLRLVSDRPYSMDNRYVMRTLTFEHNTPNSISRKGKVDNYARR